LIFERGFDPAQVEAMTLDDLVRWATRAVAHAKRKAVRQKEK
jgi:hypothetical protein